MQSSYADRPTVGTIYREAQKNDMRKVTVGEVNKEMLQGLVDDINNAVESNPFDGDPFFINVVEERDLQMPNTFKRRIFKTKYRPYPEDNTLVFYIEPENNRVCFCWDLPHHSEMWNIIFNEHLYDAEYIQRIKEWQVNNLENFGFEKTPDGENWLPKLHWKDKTHQEKKPKISLII